MVPLRDKLCADHDIETALRDVVELGAQALDGFNEVARKNKDAAVGKKLCRFLMQPLDAGTDGHEAFGGVASRTMLGRRHRESAVVAYEAPLKAVIDQPCITI